MRRLAWVAAVFVVIAGCSAPAPASPPPPSVSGSVVVATIASTLPSASSSNEASLSTAAQPAETSVDQVVGSAAPAIAASASGADPPPADPTTAADAATTDTNVAVMLIRPFGGESYGVIRPESLRSTSGGETVIDEIVWSSWTATEAHATATREFLDCTPSCAAGTVHPEPMTIDLSNPVGGVFRTLVTHVLDETQTTNADNVSPGWFGYTDAGPDSSHVPLPDGYGPENFDGASPATAAPPAAPSDESAIVQSSLITPSGNIRCVIDTYSNQFVCTIFKFDFEIGPCVEGYVHFPLIHLESTGTPTMDTCIGDFWVHKPQEPTSYGNRYQLKDIVCDVEETGVTCTNPEGHGFTVNRAAFTPF